MNNPTREQVFRYGSELRRLMKTEAFTYAVQCLQDQYKSDFFSSAYPDSGKREEAYRMNRALDELISTMETIVFIAQNETHE